MDLISCHVWLAALYAIYRLGCDNLGKLKSLLKKGFIILKVFGKSGDTTKESNKLEKNVDTVKKSNEFQTQHDVIRICADVITEPYAGNPTSLQSFIDKIELLERVIHVSNVHFISFISLS